MIQHVQYIISLAMSCDNWTLNLSELAHMVVIQNRLRGNCQYRLDPQSHVTTQPTRSGGQAFRGSGSRAVV